MIGEGSNPMSKSGVSCPPSAYLRGRCASKRSVSEILYPETLDDPSGHSFRVMYIHDRAALGRGSV
jgi:hypothetical protein